MRPCRPESVWLWQQYLLCGQLSPSGSPCPGRCLTTWPSTTMASRPLLSCPYLSSPLLFSGEELLQLNIRRLASSQNCPLQDSIPASLHSFYPPKILCPRACHDAMLGPVFSEVKSCFVVPLAAERMDASQMRFCMNEAVSKARQTFLLLADRLGSCMQDCSRRVNPKTFLGAQANLCYSQLLLMNAAQPSCTTTVRASVACNVKTSDVSSSSLQQSPPAVLLGVNLRHEAAGGL